MKKQLTLLAACVLAGAAGAYATCWRINPSPFAKAQFKTVAEAMADINVVDGDTLLLDPGTHGYVDTRSRKNITVIGPGYFLDQNKNWTESQTAVISTQCCLGENSKIEGCIIKAYPVYGITAFELGKNAVVERCKLNYVAASNENTISGCMISSLVCGGYSKIYNNILIGDYNVSFSGGEGVIFENNIVIGNKYGVILEAFVNSQIKNNIIINTIEGFDANQVPYTSITLSYEGNNVIQNNVLSTAERYKNLSYPNNYYVGATVENTFVNEGSDDAKWQLLSTSAAKGAATHGGDCGAFGGPTPYVLSGIPMFLPHITEALVPAKPTNGKITVKLKIENQNE